MIFENFQNVLFHSHVAESNATVLYGLDPGDVRPDNEPLRNTNRWRLTTSLALASADL